MAPFSSASEATRMRVAVGLVCGAVVAFVLLRYFAAGSAALLLAQIVFLSVPAAGALLAAYAATIAPVRSRARVMWAPHRVLGGDALRCLSSDTRGGRSPVPTWTRSEGSRTSRPRWRLLGFVCIVVLLSGVERLGRRRALRAVLDIAAVSTLAFVLAFGWWIARLDAGMPGSEFVAAIRLAVYVSIGRSVLAGDVIVLRATRSGPRIDEWSWLLASGIAVYGFAVVCWPVWSLATISAEEPWWIEPVTTAAFLVGYALFALAAASRVIHRSDTWHLGRVPEVRRSAWPSIASATLVLLSAAVIGFALIRAPHQSPEAAVYSVGLIITTVCLVGRTALSSDEVARLTSASGTDAITGAYNRRLLDDRASMMLVTARRFGEPFCVAVVDIDDMEAVNREFGHDAGDVVLTAVAEGLGRVVGANNVFRIGGDEFAVVLSCDGRPGARAAAGLLSDTVGRVDVVPKNLSASVGYVLCTDGASSPDELLAHASTAVLWAKNHGKRQVVEFDERMRRGSLDQHAVEWLGDPARQRVARALLGLVGSGDATGPRHARNVAALAVLLAENLGLASDEIERIELAALLHDVGAIAVAESTAAGGALSERAYRQHAELGGLFVESLGVPEITAAVRAHHEHWDGSGYPDGLRHDGVPLAARILALADAYDRITSGRASGSEMSKAAALQEIDLGLGTRFDPALGERFIVAVGSTPALGWADEGSPS